MNLIAIFVLALAISLDGFVVGITYGLKKIELSYLSTLIISIASGIAILLSMSLGSFLSKFIASVWTSKIGGVILIGLGIWSFYDALHQLLVKNQDIEKDDTPKELFTFKINSLGLIVNILHEPVKADFDYSGAINNQEALFLGIALSLDAFGAGIGAVMVGYPPLTTVFLVIGCNFILLNGGLQIGKQVTCNKLSSMLRLLPGLILILLGLTKLF
ncbi:putative sporulation protein YtaF [Halobacteroides halobius DSM 5150]|uniref:Putative sporulation protein YtaF n=1 Tax=Halobacteroides halobius (strain ATCC 35273 / DSM 5150 / MD-1) TaxID=748449 RepID=L0K5Z0_HALHC|nr:sporulation membrane protein YtaF [Halobacteroides halobius]AGB40426.1 putative sporulation protein YtaF [Halobacteroides halobius DSM 5150]